MNSSNSQICYFVPTRNSSDYILMFYDHLKEFGIDPLYIVDGRSIDNTYDLLVSRGANALVVYPKGSFGVTELVEAAANMAQTRWLFRLDDDELPSRQMVEFIQEYASANYDGSNEKLCFNREWIKTYRSQHAFFRSSIRCAGTRYDGQFRLFFNHNLSFEHHIHTAGISAPVLPVVDAPENCFIVHFDALLKSTLEKLKKMRHYEDLEVGSAWTYADLYLPELYDDNVAYSHHRQCIEQFLPLARKLPRVETKLPELRSKEFQAVASLGIPGIKPVRLLD